MQSYSSAASRMLAMPIRSHSMSSFGELDARIHGSGPGSAEPTWTPRVGFAHAVRYPCRLAPHAGRRHPLKIKLSGMPSTYRVIKPKPEHASTCRDHGVSAESPAWQTVTSRRRGPQPGGQVPEVHWPGSLGRRGCLGGGAVGDGAGERSRVRGARGWIGPAGALPTRMDCLTPPIPGRHLLPALAGAGCPRGGPVHARSRFHRGPRPEWRLPPSARWSPMRWPCTRFWAGTGIAVLDRARLGSRGRLRGGGLRSGPVAAAGDPRGTARGPG